MPIVLLRVDERLIHGQVVLGWGEHLHMDRIIVVDDEISDSAWEQGLYCLGVPPSMDAMFVSVDQAKSAVSAWREDTRRITVLVRDCDTLERLADGRTLNGLEVNLGGIHAAEGRDPVLPYLFLSPSDREALQRVATTGVTVTARDLPTTRPIPLEDLLARAK